MIKLSFRYLRKNKKQSLTIIIGIILASVLLFSVGILFSSFREFLIDRVLENNDYHVKIKGYISDDKNIISLKEKDNFYYIKFDDIGKTYEYTERICHTDLCEDINYNTKLLSLYGVGDENYLELFKSLIVGIVFILSISVFFIIYNCFQISFTKKKRDIFLLMLSGADRKQIYKVFFLEEIICGVLGVGLGLVLSIVLNMFIIEVINNVFFEFLNGNLNFYFYGPFILIPFIFIMMIVFMASILPLLKIRKYKIISIFKDDDIERNIALKKTNNFILSYAWTNYERSKKKYRGIILCIFILIVLFNSCMIFFNYMSRIFDSYINLPEYDVALISDSDESEKLKDLVSFLNADKYIIFKSCEQKVSIPKKYYRFGYQKMSNLFITNLGDGEVINEVSDVNLVDDKMYRVNYKPFRNLKELVIGDYRISVKLTDEIPFGFDNMLSEGNYVLNLGEDDFNLVCPKYETRAFIKTDEQGLDNKIEGYGKKNDLYDLSYVNVKKGYEFIDNFVFILKLFMLICIFIIGFIFIFAISNVVSANIKIRKKEFAILKSLGFVNKNINLCLLFESFIICFKGAFYAFPFILLISRYLYLNFGNFFDIKFIIMDYRWFLISFLIGFILVLMSMFICHWRLYRVSLINNIKDDKF